MTIDTTDQQAVTVAQGYAEAEAMLRDLIDGSKISDTAIRVARDHMVQFHRLASVSSASAEGDGQDRKFAFRNGQFVNRVSGEPIPHDEPVIIFRARDNHSLPVLREYLTMASDPHHRQAIKDRMGEFAAWRAEHPDRVKEPGITHHIRLNDATEPVPATNQAGEVANRRRLALEDASALERIAEEADENGWLDWAAMARQSAESFRAALATQPATSQEGEACEHEAYSVDTAGQPTRCVDCGASMSALAATPTPPTLSEDLREGTQTREAELLLALNKIADLGCCANGKTPNRDLFQQAIDIATGVL